MKPDPPLGRLMAVVLWLSVLVAAGTLDQTDGVLADTGLVSAYYTAKKAAAINHIVGGFNYLASHAGELRAAMNRTDGDAFDAIMRDIMGALEAIPGLRMRDSRKTDLIRVTDPRPDRLSQLGPDIAGLAGFFRRLQKAGNSAAARKQFARSEREAGRMLAALPEVLPTTEAIR